MFVQEENLCVCNKQKVGDMSCNEHINCSDCPSYGGDIKQNSILFLLQGEIRIDGLHFPHLIIHNKQLLVIPVGIELDFEIIPLDHRAGSPAFVAGQFSALSYHRADERPVGFFHLNLFFCNHESFSRPRHIVFQ